MRILILCFTVLIGALVGYAASDELRHRRDYIRCIAAFLNELKVQIRYFGIDLFELFKRLSSSKSLEQLSFLSAIPNEFSPYDDFGTLWNKAVTEDNSLDTESRDILIELGDFLGKSDVDGQMSIIDAASIRINALEKRTDEEYFQRSRLYRILGILFGIMTGLIFI